MTTKKSNLIKKITLDMPLNEKFDVTGEGTVGNFLKKIRKLPGLSLAHNDVEYYLECWDLGKNKEELSFQVNTNSLVNCPEYIQIFTDRENNFFQFIQYARYLDGTFVYEDLVDWKKVKVYDVFKPGWLK